jgi:hypothetical protein
MDLDIIFVFSIMNRVWFGGRRTAIEPLLLFLYDRYSLGVQESVKRGKPFRGWRLTVGDVNVWCSVEK